jgi:hypothetical protein
VRNKRTHLAVAHVKDVAFFCYELLFARSEVRFGDCLLLCVAWWHGGAYGSRYGMLDDWRMSVGLADGVLQGTASSRA